MKKICIIDGNAEYYRLFLNNNFEIINDSSKADMVLFTGGEDVSPSLYGEKTHPKSSINPFRDKYESTIFESCLSEGIPMVGICRGGQFLNVKSGGKMYQHVTNHIGDHIMVCRDTDKRILVSSTHHQMMRPSNAGYILAYANQGGVRENMSNINGINTSLASKQEEDCEVVYYANTKCLCFQPHPEFRDDEYDDMRDFFFDCIKTYLV